MNTPCPSPPKLNIDGFTSGFLFHIPSYCEPLNTLFGLGIPEGEKNPWVVY